MRVRAAVCHAFGAPLSVEEVELGDPAAGEVRVRVAACAICHSDIHSIEGAWGGPVPAVFGHEAAGTVTAVGPHVVGLREGDRVAVSLIRSCGRCPACRTGEPVFCSGSFALADRVVLRTRDGRPIAQGLGTAAFAEQVVVHASQAQPIPPELPFATAALLGCGVLTGVGAVRHTADVPAGASVVVIGTGGVGLNAVQGAVLAGAAPIIAVDISESKLAAARTFGATHALAGGNGDLGEAVAGLTDGRGADYVLVTVGSGRAIAQGLGLLRRGGTLVVVGMPASGVLTTFDPGQLAHDGLRIVGSKMGSARPQTDVPELVGLWREGRLKLDELVSGRYPLERIDEAIASVGRGEALRNVIVFPEGGP